MKVLMKFYLFVCCYVGWRFGFCYGLDGVFLGSCVEVLVFSVMVFGDGVFGWWLGLEEVVRVGFYFGISVFVRRG